MGLSLAKILKKTLHNLYPSHPHPQLQKDPKKTNANEPVFFTTQLEENVRILKSFLKNSDDLVVRYIEIPSAPPIAAAIVFLDSLTDGKLLESTVLTPLTQGIAIQGITYKKEDPQHIDSLLKGALVNKNIALIPEANNAVDTILSGSGILLFHGYSSVVSVDTEKIPAKKHTQPQTEQVIRGPQEGFVEDIGVNITMIRKRIKSPHLHIHKIQLGRETKTELAVVYLDHIVDLSIVKEVFHRLERIDVDGISGSSNIEDYITDHPTNLFQTTFYTERPDRVQSMLLEGRIAIFCDNTPFQIIVPAIVSDFFITTESYYFNPYFSTINRFIAYIGAFILVFLPGIYVALSTFHQEMIPTKLALTLAGTRAGVPYPAFVEALLMELAFEALREAGTRLPTQVGEAVSIVGALIIGQAAVEAGLVSPAVVIVVAVTAIFSFTIPYTNFSLSLRLVRFLVMGAGAVLGIYGLMTVGYILALNLVSLRSFGVPFMLPFAPVSLVDMKDWVFRFPQWAITQRSSYIVKDNLQKKASDLKPATPNHERKNPS